MKVIDQLVDAAYDTGYYSGKGHDGLAHHKKAILRRECLRHELLDRQVQVNALVDAARTVVEVARKEIAIVGCTCGPCTRRAQLADALAPFTVPE